MESELKWTMNKPQIIKIQTLLSIFFYNFFISFSIAKEVYGLQISITQKIFTLASMGFIIYICFYIFYWLLSYNLQLIRFVFSIACLFSTLYNILLYNEIYATTDDIVYILSNLTFSNFQFFFSKRHFIILFLFLIAPCYWIYKTELPQVSGQIKSFDLSEWFKQNTKTFTNLGIMLIISITLSPSSLNIVGFMFKKYEPFRFFNAIWIYIFR
jgi:hypothetical protein